MRRAAQLLRRTAPYALTGATVAACDDDKFTVEKVNVIRIPHLRDQGFPGANKSNVAAFGYAKFVSDEDCVLGDIVVNGPSHTTKAYTRAGPREKLHFDPKDSRCAIVTCGGLCPGLNTVVKNLVEILESRYGVERIYGIRGGYCGFTSVGWDAPLELTADGVANIHREGGTILGTSRGGFEAEKIVEWLRVRSRRPAVLWCLPCDSSPGVMDVGGFFFNFDRAGQARQPVICDRWRRHAPRRL